MLASHPGQIIRKVVQRALEGARARNALAQAPEENPLFVGVANIANALTREAPAEIVDQGRAQNCRITQCKALVEVYDCMFGRFSWVGRHAEICKVGERAPPKNRMISTGSKFVISSCDVIPVVFLDRPLKAKPRIVKTEAITLRVIIRQRKSIEVGDHCRIRTHVQRVHGGEIVWGKPGRTSRNCVAGAAESLHAAAWAGAGNVAGIENDAVTQ